MRFYVKLILALVFVAFAAGGCGETLNGMARDVKRVGRGVKTVFFRDADD